MDQIIGSLGGADMPGTVMAGVLAVLALLDSTSFGTLLIPLWLLMAPGRVRPGRVLLFLGTAAGFYLAVGVAVMLGAGAFVERFGDALSSRPAYIAQVVIGVGLFLWSFALDSPAAKARARQAAETGGGRINRWRARAMGGTPLPDAAATGPTAASPGVGHGAGGGAGTGGAAAAVDGSVAVRTFARPDGAGHPDEAARPDGAGHPDEAGRGAAPVPLRALMGLALAAAALEVATMLPYLAGIGLITAQGPGMPGNLAWLAGYCLVMVAPALVLTVARVVAAPLVRGPLERLDRWLTGNAASTTAWVIGAVGALLALNGANTLGWL